MILLYLQPTGCGLQFMDSWNEAQLCQHMMVTAIITCAADGFQRNRFVSWHLFWHGGVLLLLKTLASAAHKILSN